MLLSTLNIQIPAPSCTKVRMRAKKLCTFTDIYIYIYMYVYNIHADTHAHKSTGCLLTQGGQNPLSPYSDKTPAEVQFYYQFWCDRNHPGKKTVNLVTKCKKRLSFTETEKIRSVLRERLKRKEKAIICLAHLCLKGCREERARLLHFVGSMWFHCLLSYFNDCMNSF